MSTREETLERLREQAANDEPTQEEELTPVVEEVSKRSTIREYIVFINTGNAWREETRTNAGSAESAIRTLGDKLKTDAEYAACPSRNWSVGTPKVETTTSIKIKFK